MVSQVRHLQGRLTGRMESIGFDLRSEAVLETLTSDVIRSSEIEGEILNPDEVRSSVAKRLEWTFPDCLKQAEMWMEWLT